MTEQEKAIELLDFYFKTQTGITLKERLLGAKRDAMAHCDREIEINEAQGEYYRLVKRNIVL